MPSNGSSALHAAIGRYAEHTAVQARPELAATRHAVEVADQHVRDARAARAAAEKARADQFDELGLGSLAYTDRPAQQLAAAEGNLHKLPMPTLPRLDGWKIYDPKISVQLARGDNVGGNKTAEYLLLPERPVLKLSRSVSTSIRSLHPFAHQSACRL